MSISSIMNETAAYQLVDKLDAASNSATVTLKDKDGKQTVIWTLSGAKVDSESISSSIGSNKTVDLTLSTQIGGPSDLKNGLYMSGANGTAAFSS
jgi:23S rRNA pseudoU1915 N3-methylase RlmH